MPPRKLSAMTPEDLEAKVEALTPAWAKDYIRQLEGLTRTLHAQLQAALAQDQVDLSLAGEISDARDGLAAKLPAQPETAPEGTQITWPAGIRAPNGEYATARVLDGAANMEPLADLAEAAEVRFADFYQVHYGAHETSGGARALIVETDQPMTIRPVGWGAVIISRA
jgi:hypothetical protein